MPYLIAIVVLGLAVGVFFFLKSKKPAEPTPAKHQGEFNAIFPSQYGGNTYEATQQAGVIFFCTEGALKGKEFALTEGLIGGDPQAKLALPNEATSAQLSLENGKYLLRSVNGQSFNHNDKTTTEARLSSGDTLTFGKITMKLQVNS